MSTIYDVISVFSLVHPSPFSWLRGITICLLLSWDSWESTVRPHPFANVQPMHGSPNQLGHWLTAVLACRGAVESHSSIAEYLAFVFNNPQSGPCLEGGKHGQ
jgi:hypothetical protein